HRFGESLVLDHVARRDWVAAEAPDRETRTINGQRRNNGVYTGAVRQTSIHHGRRLIHAPAHARDDAINNLHEVLIVFEAETGRLQFASAFHVYTVITVYQDVGDAGILEQRLQRTQSKDFIQDLASQTLALRETEGHGFAVH